MNRLRLGLRLKFIVLISLLIVITSVALSQFLLDHLESREVQSLKSLGTTIARNLAYNAELGVLTRNRIMLHDLCEGPLREPNVAYLRVRDLNGEELVRLDAVPGLALLGHEPGDPGRPGTPWGPSANVLDVQIVLPGGEQAHGLEVRVPVSTTDARRTQEEIGFLLEEPAHREDREVIGSVVVGLSLEDSEAEIARVRSTFGGLTTLVVVFGVMMTVLIVQLVVKPVKRMVVATRRIAEGKLDEKVEASSHDEIGELGRSFNRMTDNLRLSRDALESYSADLEEKVRQRTAELERAQSQLVQAEKMSAMGELVSGVAHELNNPLAGVLGYSQLLLGSDVHERARRGLERINREAERCKRIVQNLQVFARKHKPQKNYVGINGILDSTLDLRAYQMKVDNVRVTTQLQPDLPKTMADFHQLQQVFVNLLVNAHHAIRAGQRPGEVAITTSTRSGRIVVEISDNGCGISSENLSKIFDPFFTTKEVGQGTGLGLSICYGIVQEHRGRIHATSRVGEGTTFVVELPILAPPPGHAEAQDSGRGIRVPEPVRRSLRHSNILVVDDEASILDVLHQALELDGHRVDTAANGRVALNKIRGGENYDVIISDLKMPGMSGIELYESVRDFSQDVAKRIVFSTGDVASVETQAFLERSGNRYVQKPFDLNALRKLIASLTVSLPN